MKKNGLMRVSAFLLVSTMITSCFVGGTFAKYVTEGEGIAEARVAKWGVEVSSSADLFGSRYDSVNGQTVEASDGVTHVVAPGTSTIKPFTIELSGTPEVSGKYTTVLDIDFTNDGKALNAWMIKPNGEALSEDESYGGAQETEFYCPLQFIINGAEGSPVDGSNYTSPEELVEAINQKIVGLANGEFDAGDDLSAKGTILKIEWEWPYEGDRNSNQTDEKDTYLGNKAAAGYENPIKITATTTVEQID